MERYRKIRVLGKGSFGSAWLAESSLNGKNYALKELTISTLSDQDRDFALNEVKILSKLKHRNIVRYKEAFFCDSTLYIAMEFAEEGMQGASGFGPATISNSPQFDNSVLLQLDAEWLSAFELT